MGSLHCIAGEGEFLNIFFKIPIIFFVTDCLKFTKKKKKDEVLCSLFQITEICFNESDYVTLHIVLSIMTENDSKMSNKMPQ